MNGLIDFRLCTLSDEELMNQVDEQTDMMFLIQEIPTRHIPARPNQDYDLLIGELLVRFKEKSEKAWMYDQLDK